MFKMTCLNKEKQDKYLHDNHILDRMNLHHDKYHNILQKSYN